MAEIVGKIINKPIEKEKRRIIEEKFLEHKPYFCVFGPKELLQELYEVIHLQPYSSARLTGRDGQSQCREGYMVMGKSQEVKDIKDLVQGIKERYPEAFVLSTPKHGTFTLKDFEQWYKRELNEPFELLEVGDFKPALFCSMMWKCLSESWHVYIKKYGKEALKLWQEKE